MQQDFPDQHFSPVVFDLLEVMRMERWAWRPASSEYSTPHLYDGINFWLAPPQSERVLAGGTKLPSDGWHHRATCNCELCRARRVDA